MKRIYLSGPISGRPIEQARNLFDRAEKYIREKVGVYPEVMVFNPLKFTEYSEDKKWADYMHPCLAVLESCDMIIMLPGWEQSHGAQCEYHFACGCGILTSHLTTQDIFR